MAKKIEELVLYIDEDAKCCLLLESFFRSNGFDFHSASSTSEGLQKAIELLPSIIICEKDFSGLSGNDLIKMLREIATTSLVPIVVYASVTEKDDILSALSAGAEDFVEKRDNPSDLLNVVNNRIAKKRLLEQENDKRLKLLLEHIQQGALVLDYQHIDYVNDAFAEYVGYNSQELVGNNLINIVYTEDIMIVATAISNSWIGATNHFKTKFRAIKRDNTLVWIDFWGTLTSSAGNKRLIVSATCAPCEAEKKRLSENEVIEVNLSNREIEVLAYICKGLTSAEIANEVCLSERTIEGHKARLFQKTSTKSTLQLAMWAVKNKFYSVE
ncbi:MAG: LuxR C-terminal-related transcriptional regulator [Tenuifilaceae bacterium]|jgi:PAS domain S-box-containing protein|nr:LuxR C-terminal-related transcriptional regulator [Tenuifilaceae bacterium]